MAYRYVLPDHIVRRQVYLLAEHWTALNLLAQSRGISRSDYLRLLISEHLQEVTTCV